jgi:hypothetical protein
MSGRQDHAFLSRLHAGWAVGGCRRTGRDTEQA